MMELFRIRNETSYQEALKAVALLVEKQNLTDEESFFLNHQALEIEQWEEVQADIDYQVKYIEDLELRKLSYQKQVARLMRRITHLEGQIHRRKKKLERKQNNV